MSREKYLVRSEVIAGFDDLVKELGSNPKSMYLRVGLAESLMSDPEHRVPVADVSALLDVAARELGRDDFGLLLGERRKVFQIGLLWPLISHCPTVEQALKTVTEHLHLHNQGILWQLNAAGDHALLSRVDRVPSAVPTFQWAVYCTSSMFAGLKALCGKKWQPSTVQFIHPTPGDRRGYDRFFGVKVEFNRQFNLIDFPAADLGEDLVRRNSGLYRQLTRQIQDLEAEYERQEDFCSKIKLLIEQLMHTEDCTLAAIAGMLSMHPKALQRELNRRGVSFRELKAEVRLDIAERYLQDSELPLTTVADILGFSELSSFSHAFKVRHQLSPAEWRKQVKAKVA